MREGSRLRTLAKDLLITSKGDERLYLKRQRQFNVFIRIQTSSTGAEQPEGALYWCNLMALCSQKSKSSGGFQRVPSQALCGFQD